MVKTLDASKALDILFPFIEEKNGHTYTGFHHTTPFRALIGTMLSLRARGATVGRVAGQLFKLVSKPQDILDMPSETLSGIIRPLGHGERREKFIRETCQIIMDQHHGKVPNNMEDLLALPGVGRKTANLTLDAGFGQLTMTVDTHVHRIMNIWGYVATRNADETEEQLREHLPKKYWKAFNPLLVDFGNLVCWPASPKCDVCPLTELCPKLGVAKRSSGRQIGSETTARDGEI